MGELEGGYALWRAWTRELGWKRMVLAECVAEGGRGEGRELWTKARIGPLEAAKEKDEARFRPEGSLSF